jgi:crotonobetainyl-CoA:carnitine CoA-transferase CaiB-like acyl-CoA transferase
MTLADLGCEVIKVEAPPFGDDSRTHQPPGKDGEAASFLGLNRSKRSVLLDLTVPEAREIARALALRSDILVENFRPGAMERLGLGYAALSEANPQLIYCAISGYGHTGAFRDLPGYDPVVQAEGGLMHLTGDPACPPVRAAGSVVDVLTGLHAGMGVLAALQAREKTGRGQFVDLALYGSLLSTIGFVLQGVLLTGEDPPRTGNVSFFMAPNGAFRCADGRIMVSAGNDRLFAKLCRALDLPALLADPRFTTNTDRVRHVEALNAALEARLAERPREAWIAVLREAGVPVGAVRSPREALAAPETLASGLLHTLIHPKLGPMQTIGSPIRLSGTPVRPPQSPPLLGEHTEAVLQDVLGLDAAHCDALRRSGALGPPRPAATEQTA